MSNFQKTSSVDIRFTIDFYPETIKKIKTCFKDYYTANGEPVKGECVMCGTRYDSKLIEEQKNNIKNNPDYFFLITYTESMSDNQTPAQIKRKICEELGILNTNQVIIVPIIHKFNRKGIDGITQEPDVGYEKIIAESLSAQREGLSVKEKQTIAPKKGDRKITTNKTNTDKTTIKNTATDNLNLLLDSYLNKRQAIINTSGTTKEYFYGSFFSVFQKSFTQKREAVHALQQALDGNEVDLNKHLATLRNGTLGKKLRMYIKSGAANTIAGKEVSTVTDFVQALQDKISGVSQKKFL